MARVQADPALASERSVRTLRWKSGDDGGARERGSGKDWRWLRDLFSWIAQASRLLMWIVIVALVALLAYGIARVVLAVRPGGKARAARFFAPSHVRDLDIRPESLPDDIGAAARALWDDGRQRAALALLYRGLLSRLAHVHRVPIRASSTEGECIALAAGLLDARAFAYANALVRAWQSAIYGGIAADAASVHELCAGFAPSLDARPADASKAMGAPA